MTRGGAAAGRTIPSFAGLFPETVVHATVGTDSSPEGLHPEEEQAAARFTSTRRHHFALGRTCARRALAGLGAPAQPIGVRPDRSPSWPTHIVGAITHCDGLAAAAVARDRDFVAIGLDAEPADRRLDPRMDRLVCTASERSALGALPPLPDADWLAVVFSGKEAVYKALGPLAGRTIGYHEVELAFDPERAEFAVRYGPSARTRLPDVGGAIGRYAVIGGFLLTTLVLPR